MLKQPLWFTNVPTAADDVALIAFTSGTTGKPKGTMHFHRDVVAMCDCFPRSILKAHKDDIFCGTPPLAFTFGLGGMLCFPMRFGASTVLVEKHTPETPAGDDRALQGDGVLHRADDVPRHGGLIVRFGFALRSFLAQEMRLGRARRCPTPRASCSRRRPASRSSTASARPR